VTSPASGANGAPDLPDYAPIPRSALGPALNDQGYYVGRVERNLYWVTDGTYQSAFLTTPDGVVLFDAPPTIGGNLRRAVDEITAAEGVPNTVTHLVYSHHHDDHAGASSLFGSDVVRVGHEETRRLLLRDDDAARPPPEVTVNPGWVPIYNLNLSEDVPGYIQAPTTALSYPWRHFIGGHLGRLGTRHAAPAVHRRHRGRRAPGTRHGRPDPVLPEVRRERLGRGEDLPQHPHRPRRRARDCQVHRSARRLRRRGVHNDHHLPDPAVDPSRPSPTFPDSSILK